MLQVTSESDKQGINGSRGQVVDVETGLNGGALQGERRRSILSSSISHARPAAPFKFPHARAQASISVFIFKAKWASSDSSLEYWNNEILTYWNIRFLRNVQAWPKACKTSYIPCKAESCLTGQRSGTPDSWPTRVPSALSIPWVFIAVIMNLFLKCKVRLRIVSGTGRKQV